MKTTWQRAYQHVFIYLMFNIMFLFVLYNIDVDEQRTQQQ